MLLMLATSAFGLGRKRSSSPQQCHLHCLRTLKQVAQYLEQNQLINSRSISVSLCAIHTRALHLSQVRALAVPHSGNNLRRVVHTHVTKHYHALLHPFNGLFSRTTWVSSYQKGKTSLDLNETKDDEALGCSGISWTICKQSAPRSRDITTPTPHHSILQAGCSSLGPTNSVKALKAYLFTKQ